MSICDGFPAEAFFKITNKTASQASIIGGGRNSRVFCVETTSGQKYVLKSYFLSDIDKRDRLGIESAAYANLIDIGFENIPQFFGADTKEGIAVYSFFSGDKLQAEQINIKHIDLLVDFILSLQADDVKNKFLGFGIASEACFCPNEIKLQLDKRLARLDNIDANIDLNFQVIEFLQEEVKPFLNRCWQETKRAHYELELQLDKILDAEYRVLSPSDFGFHNILLSSDEELQFFDFEYFGWDAPEKTISDFLLHPAIEIPDALRLHFAQKIINGLPHDKQLKERVKIVFNLWGVKWCLIMLNEFVQNDQKRRDFAGQHPEKATRQFEKAKKLLNELKTQRLVNQL